VTRKLCGLCGLLFKPNSCQENTIGWICNTEHALLSIRRPLSGIGHLPIVLDPLDAAELTDLTWNQMIVAPDKNG
jgi:hypothetical protein